MPEPPFLLHLLGSLIMLLFNINSLGHTYSMAHFLFYGHDIMLILSDYEVVICDR